MIAIHNAENWLGMDGDSELSMFNKEGGGNGSGKKLMLDGVDDIVVAPPKSKYSFSSIISKTDNDSPSYTEVQKR